jgi:hypothetical protein
MRTRLLLVLLAVPALCAALSGDAAAQRRDHGRAYVHREGHGYRDRIFIPSHRYKEGAGRFRDNDRYRDAYRDDGRRYRDTYRDADRYRDNDRYRDQYGYRDQSGYRNRDQVRYRDRYGYQYGRRRVNLVDLVLIAAGARYRDGYGHRHGGRCRYRRGIHIDL